MDSSPPTETPVAPQPKDFDQLCREAGYKSYKEKDGTIVVQHAPHFTTCLIGRLYLGESVVHVETHPRLRFCILLTFIILSGHASIAVALLAWFVLHAPARQAWFQRTLGGIYQKYKQGVFE